MSQIIMAWGKCKIELAPASTDGNMPSTGLKTVGTIKDKSTTLESADGDDLS